jgi:hypothetical protein
MDAVSPPSRPDGEPYNARGSQRGMWPVQPERATPADLGSGSGPCRRSCCQMCTLCRVAGGSQEPLEVSRGLVDA